MERKRLGVLVSGRGSNLQALIDASKDAIERAKRENIPVFVIRREDYKSKKEYEEKIKEVLQNFKVDLVVLAGYMKIVGKTLLEAFPNRIINIHPSLLPSFPGLEAQRQAWEYGVKISGCTVHFVDEGIDSGPIIGQRAVPVYDDDTPATLAERILQEEHKLIVESVKKILTEDFEIIGRRVVFKKRG